MCWWKIEVQMRSSFLERQMFLRHWVRCVQTLEILLNVKKLHQSYILAHRKGQISSTCPFIWAQTSLEKKKLFEEDFFPPLWEEYCVRSTVLNTKLLPRCKNGFVLWRKPYSSQHKLFPTIHFLLPLIPLNSSLWRDQYFFYQSFSF